MGRNYAALHAEQYIDPFRWVIERRRKTESVDSRRGSWAERGGETPYRRHRLCTPTMARRARARLSAPCMWVYARRGGGDGEGEEHTRVHPIAVCAAGHAGRRPHNTHTRAHTLKHTRHYNTRAEGCRRIILYTRIILSCCACACVRACLFLCVCWCSGESSSYCSRPQSHAHARERPR